MRAPLSVAIASLLLTTPAFAASTPFTANLSLGSSGIQVLELQQVLNKDVATRIAASGPGSAGEETGYFGLLTQAAVERFQEKYASQILVPAGLAQPNGFVGYYTRLELNALLSSGSVTTPVPTTPTPTTPTICGPGVTYNSLTGAPCSTTTTPTSFTPSPAGTTIPGVSQIVDAAGAVWINSNGTVYRNGTGTSYLSNFTELYYSGTALYQESAACRWWVWNGSAWTATSDPAPGVTPSCAVAVTPTIPSIPSIGCASGDLFDSRTGLPCPTPSVPATGFGDAEIVAVGADGQREFDGALAEQLPLQPMVPEFVIPQELAADLHELP